jgi:uncharacterized membrane protein
MKHRYLLLSWLVVLAVFAATAWCYPGLPERIPLHWNVNGEIDGYGGRPTIFMLPLLMAGVLALVSTLPRTDPRRYSTQASGDTYWLSALVVTSLLGYIQALLLVAARGDSLDLPRALVGGIAVFIALLGNVMGKVRRNFWLGVRTPWTLANERVWYATHRLAAKTMVAGSLLALAVVLAGLHPMIGVALIVAGALAPVAYSLVYYKRLERDGRLEA